MPKAAADVVRSVLFSAVIDAIEALRASSKGLPNNMLRDLQSIHRNTAFEDLPKEVQDSIVQSVRSAFGELLKEGYAVGPRNEVQSRPMDRVPERQRGGPGERRGPMDRRDVRRGPGRRGPGRPNGNGPGKGPRPPRKPQGS
ncbi:hypothetical protein [Sphingomonas alba]|uniref:Uncharacterized protein n=1 Tax=Sphingomonas alba TaxID=2908208 RepID=A0ABT0RJB5_9SPHN|nr:hypothetical protein [Sphingomonas alba]MCL6682722.1 hypothetical protein [Sphingomonas alba]